LAVLDCFLMPRAVKITGRTSTLTNAFVNGVVPCYPPTENEVLEALSVLGLDHADLRCAYCGDPFTEWDHLRPLIAGKRPTGFITEIANLVPACGKCNQSKSGSAWRKWMLGPAKRSPATRGIPDLDERVRRLEAYESWRIPRVFDFEAAAGKDLWARHWNNWTRLVSLMGECERTAEEIRTTFRRAVG